MGEVEIRRERSDEDAGRALLMGYIADARTRIGEWDETRTPRAGAAAMAPPAGAFVVAYVDGRAVGCTGAMRQADGVAEVKRMYVVPQARGRGVARRLLAAVEEAVRDLGYGAVRLDTSAGQPEARALYESAGYRAIPPYNDNAYAAYWFEKGLADEPGRAV